MVDFKESKVKEVTSFTGSHYKITTAYQQTTFGLAILALRFFKASVWRWDTGTLNLVRSVVEVTSEQAQHTVNFWVRNTQATHRVKNAERWSNNGCTFMSVLHNAQVPSKGPRDSKMGLQAAPCPSALGQLERSNNGNKLSCDMGK